DGRFLATGGDEPGIRLFDLETAGAERLLRTPMHHVRALVYSPDGRTLAAASALHEDIVLWDPGAGRERIVLRGSPSPVQSLAFSPDGKSLASGSRNGGTIMVWDLATGRPPLRLETAAGP